MDSQVTFFQQVKSAIAQLEGVRAQIEQRMVKDPLSNTDWYGALYQVEHQIVSLRNLRYAHRLLRLDDDEAIAILKGDPNHANRSVSYVVSLNDTVDSIAANFQVAVEDLLAYNQITPEGVRPGTPLEIPTKNASAVVVNNSIPVYGSQAGQEVLGRDVPDLLAVDLTGDLVVLEPIDTVKQGLLNILQTAQGDYSLLPMFGWDNTASDMIPKEVEAHWQAVKLSQALESDPRVGSVSKVDGEIIGDAVYLFAEVVLVTGQTVGVKSNGPNS